MDNKKVEMSLPEIKENECRLLKMFRDYCDSKGLRYYLCNGTLLGAVKYSGFIPWDDDIDVCLLREDYDRFIKEFENNDQYTLFEFSRDPKYLYPFAKLSLNNTLLIESRTYNGVDLGVCIDIFPIDFVGSSCFLAKVKALYSRYLTALLQESKAKLNRNKGIYKGIFSLTTRIGRLIPADMIIRFIQRNATSKRKKKNSTYSACLAWPAYKEKEVVPSDIYRTCEIKDFEREQYCVPEGYDEYLTNLYGNYHDDPPLEKQKTHHVFKAFWIK